MKVNSIFLSGLAGTSAMTLFSYLVSAVERRNFKEPELLAELEDDVLPAQSKQVALPAGWSTHYTMGIVWAGVFHFLWHKTAFRPTSKSSLSLGILSGITGVIIWDLVFKAHPNPPRTNYKRFYGHLLLAHVVYSLVTTVTARELEKTS
jgi:hypothetical protein